MKKLLFVISSLGAGGAERVVSQLAQHWAAQGYEVEIACFDCPEEPAYHDFPPSISITRLGGKAGLLRWGRLAKLADLFALRAHIARRRPDVVLAFLTKNILLSLVAAAGSRARVVCCERNNPERQQVHWLWNATLRLAYRRADLVVCQTRAVTRCIPASVHSRIRIIPNPIGKWPVVPDRASPRTIVTAGRLTHQKGFDILIESFAVASKTCRDWRLQIWGDGPDRDWLEACARENGCADRVELMGLSETPGAWLGAAHLFVLPSRFEGFPNALGEAMAAGVPAIAADCDFGPSDMIENGVDGLLVTPEDPAALTEAMGRCMEDAQLRARLGDAAARSITRFSPENVLRKWDVALLELAGSPDAGGAQASHRRLETAE